MDFLERLFQVMPDRGPGFTEAAMMAALLLIPMVAAMIRKARGRAKKRRRHETDRVEQWRGGCRLSLSVFRLFRLTVPE